MKRDAYLDAIANCRAPARAAMLVRAWACSIYGGLYTYGDTELVQEVRKLESLARGIERCVDSPRYEDSDELIDWKAALVEHGFRVRGRQSKPSAADQERAAVGLRSPDGRHPECKCDDGNGAQHVESCPAFNEELAS